MLFPTDTKAAQLDKSGASRDHEVWSLTDREVEELFVRPFETHLEQYGYRNFTLEDKRTHMLLNWDDVYETEREKQKELEITLAETDELLTELWPDSMNDATQDYLQNSGWTEALGREFTREEAKVFHKGVHKYELTPAERELFDRYIAELQGKKGIDAGQDDST